MPKLSREQARLTPSYVTDWFHAVGYESNGKGKWRVEVKLGWFPEGPELVGLRIESDPPVPLMEGRLRWTAADADEIKQYALRYATKARLGPSATITS